MNESYADNSFHTPVLALPVVEFLITRRDGLYVDGTIGGGGHTRVLLDHLDDTARVIGIDQDPEAVAYCRTKFNTDSRVLIAHDNFRDLKALLEKEGVEAVDGILLDLGLSSHQIDSAPRGFSFQQTGPLDMRMDPSRSATAAEILNTWKGEEIANVIWKYGEERQSRRIARAIVRSREENPIRTTEDLARIVRSAVGGRYQTKTLARVFQALRIQVNRELDALEKALRDSVDVLKTGGRLVVISYHSLEDRLVKHFFRQEAATCICPDEAPICTCEKIARMRILVSKPITPRDDEIQKNPRSRSARLRAAERIT